MKKTLTEQEGIVRLVDEQLSGRLLEKLLHVVFLHPLDRFSPGRCLQRAQVARIVLHSQTYLCVSGRMERPKKNHDLLSCAAVRTISAGAHRKLPPRQRLLELLRHLLPLTHKTKQKRQEVCRARLGTTVSKKRARLRSRGSSVHGFPPRGRVADGSLRRRGAGHAAAATKEAREYFPRHPAQSSLSLEAPSPFSMFLFLGCPLPPPELLCFSPPPRALSSYPSISLTACS